MSRNKIRHRVYISHKGVVAPKRIYRSLIRRAVTVALRSEGVDVPCAVSVLIASAKVIRKFNREYRGKDKSTDVLSFPMQVFDKAGWGGCVNLDIDEDSGLLPLGDIVVSIEHVRRQARAHGHSVEREASYLIIHSTLHLLGYDHGNEKDKALMRFKEKESMGYLS